MIPDHHDKKLLRLLNAEKPSFLLMKGSGPENRAMELCMKGYLEREPYLYKVTNGGKTRHFRWVYRISAAGQQWCKENP